MTVLARRTWAQMLTETTLRVGNITSTGFDVRLQYWLAASYFNLCTTYHHVELDTAAPQATSFGVSYITLPSDLFVLIDVALVDGPIPITDFRSIFDSIYESDEAGLPRKCARFGNRLYFDRPTSPDAITVNIAYYRRGLAPDFSTPTSPELDSDVDEHIIEGALRLAWPALARPDLGTIQRELLTEWLGAQVRATTMYPLTSLAERERSTTTLTGAQG